MSLSQTVQVSRRTTHAEQLPAPSHGHTSRLIVRLRKYRERARARRLLVAHRRFAQHDGSHGTLHRDSKLVLDATNAARFTLR